MQIVTNTQLAERNRKFATYLFFATFGVLIGGFLLINQIIFTEALPPPIFLGIQVLVLIGAFVMTVLSVRMTNNWSRQPRPEDAISENLKGLSKRSRLYSYYHSPARHVLIAPQGVFAITTRWHDGRFTVTGDQWQHHRSALSRVFGLLRMDGIGNPNKDAKVAAEHLQNILSPINPEVTVDPLIVMVGPNVQLTRNDPEIPVILSSELSEYMRTLNDRIKTTSGKNKKVLLPLTDEEVEQFESATL